MRRTGRAEVFYIGYDGKVKHRSGYPRHYSFVFDHIGYGLTHDHRVAAAGEGHGYPRQNVLPLHGSDQDVLRIQNDVPRA